MNSDQQKAYDIGYNTYSSGVALTGKILVDQTAFTTNNYQAFGGDFALTSSLYSYYVKGYNQRKEDTKAMTAASTPLPDQSTLTNLIKAQFSRVKRTYTSTDISNWLSQCANLWKTIPEPKNLDKLTDLLVPMFNSLPPQATSVTDNPQDYAPLITSPSSITLPENIADLFNPTATPATTTTTTTTATPVSGSSVVDNVQDYAPSIASSSSTTEDAQTTTSTVETVQAGIGTNTLTIIILIGAALGVMFAMFKGIRK